MLCLMLLLQACAGQTVEPLTIYKTVTLYQDRYVPVKPELTEHVVVEYVPDGPVDTIDLRTTLQACQVRTQQCNGKLAEIANKSGDIEVAPDTHP